MDLFIHLYAIIGIVHRLGLDLPRKGKQRLYAEAQQIIDKVISDALKRRPVVPNDPMHYVQQKLATIRSDLEQLENEGFASPSRTASEIIAMCTLLADEDRVE